MKRMLAAALGLFAVSAALADSPQVITSGISESTPIRIDLNGNVLPDELGTGQRTVNENYDNWRSSTSTPPGSSALLGLFAAGGDEIADDLSMVAVGAGLLNDMGINVANANGPTGSTLTGGSMTIRFYNGGGTFISGFTATLPALALGPGASSRIFFGANALTSLNINLPATCFVSMQLTTVTGAGGFTLANAGYQIRGPINTGSSTDALIDVTTNTTFNFGGSPAANTGLYIKTDNVPEPASLGLIALGGLALLRRR